MTVQCTHSHGLFNENYTVCLKCREALLMGLINEFIALCAVGDVDESTEALGWGDLIKRANEALGRRTPHPS